SIAAGLSFFFQAEDGIRDGHVTGVQTCALPISGLSGKSGAALAAFLRLIESLKAETQGLPLPETIEVMLEKSGLVAYYKAERDRSEERRVGKEGRKRWAGRRGKEKTQRSRVAGR